MGTIKITGSVIFISFITLSLFFSTTCLGQGDEIPRIGIEGLKKMIEQNEEVIIIDVQPPSIYEKGHIKGAINIPYKSQLALEDVWVIPGGIPIITYCACGPGESDSNDFAKQLIKMGYNDVMVLKHPAIQGWIEAKYPVDKK
ncbi:MAG: rhodanese-like domain-containing protein [Deltaproteobacteria bacterium]|nr:rhodanese-like domain-containing protein [Deltaproteobacteria bacterium]